MRWYGVDEVIGSDLSGVEMAAAVNAAWTAPAAWVVPHLGDTERAVLVAVAVSKLGMDRVRQLGREAAAVNRPFRSPGTATDRERAAYRRFWRGTSNANVCADIAFGVQCERDRQARRSAVCFARPGRPARAAHRTGVAS